MFIDRGSKADYDAWGTLIGDDTWSWEGLYPYFIKSTTFTPPLEELKTHFDIRNNASGYGNGTIQIGYPSFIFPDDRNQTLAAEDFGIEISDAPESGDAIGFYWVPQTLDPKTGFRSHSRVVYYDPIASQSNLHLIPGHLVEKILFDDSLTATVPRNVLEAAGVQVLLDEPAVGANFQDHLVTYLSWNVTNLAFPNDATIAMNASYNASACQEIIDQARAQNVSNYLNSSALLKGYLAQRDNILDHFSRTDAAVIEIPIGTTGPGAGAGAVEKPLSPENHHTLPLFPLMPNQSQTTTPSPPPPTPSFSPPAPATSALTVPLPISPTLPTENFPGLAAHIDEEILASLD
ncbi:uncharacterized protein EAF02_002035 [Botrytis sinoallii]|uniref:uncharacterized protein n=1 Tax=Botrytis sinoallii TaxID=1463999 RepID=UPI00190116AD|nr:uncharacterized protein EAF02_002035 [Botrytis sinoallii]KAF7889620.1 hypothetical protein EAF02_002035 [Botrytis sinoallii]